MWETKTTLSPLSVILLVATIFYICQVHTEKKVGHSNEIRSPSPCEKEYKTYCLNGGECYHLVDGDIVGYSFRWLKGVKLYVMGLGKNLTLKR